MERRPLTIAGVLMALILALLAGEELRERLKVPPMPPEMQCVVKRDCSTPDFMGVPPPPTAPRLSDIQPLEKSYRHEQNSKTKPRQ